MKMTRKQWRTIAAEAQTLARDGRVVSAIKLLRAKTGCGLKKCFDAVKELANLSRKIVA